MRSLESQISWFGRMQQVLAGTLVVSVMLFYFVWYRPSTGHMQSLRDKIQQNNQSLAASRTKAGALPTVAREVTDLRQKLAQFDRKIPQRQDLPQFLGSLEAMKQEAGIVRCSLKPEAPRTNPTYSEQTIRVDFEGTFSQVASFLARVEGMDRMTRVRRLTFKGLSPTDGTVEVQMDVSIYFLEG